MKKRLSLLLMLTLSLLLFGCGKSEEAKAVEEKIRGIGEVTLDSDVRILAAQEAYNGLTEAQKEEVENVTDLEVAQAAYQEALMKELTGESWVDVKNGDSYALHMDGTCSHDDMSATFGLEGDTVTITEILSMEERVFHWDRRAKIPKLIPQDEETYYVLESDYVVLGSQLREEFKKLLCSYEWWVNGQGTNYLNFAEDFTGTLYISSWNARQAVSWTFLDNDTAEVTFPIDSGHMGYITCHLVNENGQYKLLTHDPAFSYVPLEN